MRGGTLYTTGSNVHGCLGNDNIDDEGVQYTFAPIHVPSSVVVDRSNCLDGSHSNLHENQTSKGKLDEIENDSSSLLSSSSSSSSIDIPVSVSVSVPSENDDIIEKVRGGMLQDIDLNECQRYCKNSNILSESNRTNSSLHDDSKNLRTVEMNELEVAGLACGKQHSMLLTKEGDIYSWGLNRFGQLGLGHRPNLDMLSDTEKYHGKKWKDNNLSRRADGRGSDEPEQLSHSYTSAIGDVFCPTKIPRCDDFLKEHVTTIACGSHHSLCTTQNGYLYTWGNGAYGCTGHGDVDVVRFTPTRVSETLDDTKNYYHHFVGVAAGKYHSLALSISGTIYSFGRGEEGQLGDGYTYTSHEKIQSSSSIDNNSIHFRSKPGVVFFDADDEKLRHPITARMLACSNGGNGSYALSLDGSLYQWGSYYCDRCPDEESSPSSSSTPLKIPFPVKTENASHDCSFSSIITAISAGTSHFVWTTRAGEAWAMGVSGAHLGAGPGCKVNWFESPVRMLLPGNILVNGVCCGERHTLLSTSLCQVLVCGDASFGKLGLTGADLEKSSHSFRAVPKQILFHEETELSMNNVPITVFAHPFSYASERISLFISQYKEGEYLQPFDVTKPDGNASIMNYDTVNITNDDESSDALTFELEMDYFGIHQNDSVQNDSTIRNENRYPGSNENISVSWKRRFSFEAHRKISHGTRIVGGALSSGGALISGVVSAVTRSKSMDVPNEDYNDHNLRRITNDEIEQAGSWGNLRGSFDSLMNKRTTQGLFLAAGSNHSCIYISGRL